MPAEEDYLQSQSHWQAPAIQHVQFSEEGWKGRVPSTYFLDHDHSPAEVSESPASSLLFKQLQENRDQSVLHCENENKAAPSSPPSSSPSLTMETSSRFLPFAHLSSAFIPIQGDTAYPGDFISSSPTWPHISSPLSDHHLPHTSSSVIPAADFSSLMCTSPPTVHSNVDSKLGVYDRKLLLAGEQGTNVSMPLNEQDCGVGVVPFNDNNYYVKDATGYHPCSASPFNLPSRALSPESPSHSMLSVYDAKYSSPVVATCSKHPHFYSDVLGNLTTPTSAVSGASCPFTFDAIFTSDPNQSVPSFIATTTSPVTTTSNTSTAAIPSVPVPNYLLSSSPVFSQPQPNKSSFDHAKIVSIDHSVLKGSSSSFDRTESGIASLFSSRSYPEGSAIRRLEMERAGSDASNYSTNVCLDSQSASFHSQDMSYSDSKGASPMFDQQQSVASLSTYDCNSNQNPLDKYPSSPRDNNAALTAAATISVTDASPESSYGHKDSHSLVEASLALAPPPPHPTTHVYPEQEQSMSSSLLSAAVQSSSFDMSGNPPPSLSPVSGQDQDSSFSSEKPPMDADSESSLREDILASRAHPPRNGTRDFHKEVREWIQSASSSSSVVPAPSVSSNEGSTSGSLSSHGTGGSLDSHRDIIDHLAGHHRRRSSQMSDASRRSSSSKHSSDLGTDLEVGNTLSTIIINLSIIFQFFILLQTW